MNTTNDDLFQKASDFIDTLNKYVSELSSPSISAIDVVTLVAAILAVVATFISVWVAYKSDKANREATKTLATQAQESEKKLTLLVQQAEDRRTLLTQEEENKRAVQAQEAEDRRADAAIDANITATARIAWIQDVRKATADLITACYKYTSSKEVDKEVNLEVAHEKRALFILYFGPDEDGSTELAAASLFDKETNKGKNNQLVDFINGLYIDLTPYHSYHWMYEDNKKELSKCNQCEFYSEDSDNVKHYLCKKDEYDTPFIEDDCKNFKDEKNKRIKEYKEYEDKLFSGLRELSEIMRIYCKLEWNRAKDGK